MRVEVGGVSFATVPGYEDWWERIVSGRWEPETVSAMCCLIEPGRTFWDIGAWIGPTTLLAAALGAEVHAFEPDPAARQQLEANAAANADLAPRIHVHAEAVAASTRTAPLSTNWFGSTMSSLVRVARDIDGEQVTVQTVDALAIADEIGFATDDFIKIDTEGSEYEIVPRLKPMLDRVRPNLLLAVHLYPFRESIASWPWLARGVVFRLRALPRQARLLWQVRSYPHRYVQRDGRWEVLARFGWLRVLASAREKELLLLNRPLQH